MKVVLIVVVLALVVDSHCSDDEFRRLKAAEPAPGTTNPCFNSFPYSVVPCAEDRVSKMPMTEECQSHVLDRFKCHFQCYRELGQSDRCQPICEGKHPNIHQCEDVDETVYELDRTCANIRDSTQECLESSYFAQVRPHLSAQCMVCYVQFFECARYLRTMIHPNQDVLDMCNDLHRDCFE